MKRRAPPAHDLLQRAMKAHRTGNLAEAERMYRSILARHPGAADGWHKLGLLHLQRNENEKAVNALVQAVERNGASAPFLSDLGVALKRTGRLTEALATYDRAVALQPDYAQAHNNRANILRELGRLEEADSAYRRAIEIQPDYADAWNNLGVLAHRAGRLEDALPRFDRAIALRPDYAEAHCNRGNVLKELGRLKEALAAYDQALQVKPAHSDALNNRGNVLQQQGRSTEAAESYDEALRLNPAHADALLNRGNTYKDQCRLQEARRDLAAAVALRPDFCQAHWALAMSPLVPVQESMAALEQARTDYATGLGKLIATCRADPGGLARWEEAVGANQPFYLPYHNHNDRELQQRYGELACGIMGAWQSARPTPPTRRSADGRIRLGIVSAYMHRHSVWDVITRGIVRHLDRKQFSVHCYNTGWRRDRETSEATQLADRFVRGPLPLSRWVGEITQDAPDVLLYPEIGMDPMTVKLAALRLSPVQMTAWGHPFTSGLPSMDYFLSGDLLEPPDGDDHYTEKLVRLPGLGCYFESLGIQADPVTLAELGIPVAEGMPLLVSCQQVSKYHPADDTLYVRLARALGRCRIVFIQVARTGEACLAFRQRLERVFRDAGLNPDEYLTFVPTLSRRKFLGALRLFDVYLDTPAFSGFTTAIQALACDGLPVVTLEGPFLRNRLAAALLRRIGVTETIATNAGQYVELVTRLVRDNGWRKTLRATIMARLPAAHEDRQVIASMEQLLSSKGRKW